MLVRRGMPSSGSGTICVTYARMPRSASASSNARRASGVFSERNWCTGMPRACAATLTGSGFGPASGGHTTAAIAWPAASSPRSTSSANAACPTRRTRIGSGAEMLREERLQPLPGIVRRGLLVRRALVAEEAVVRARVDDDLDVLAEPLRLGLQMLHAVERDERVLLAKEREHRATQLLRLVDRDAPTVVRHARLDHVGELAGGEVADAPAHAEPRDADPVGADERLLLEPADRVADVRHDLRVFQGLHEADRCGQLAVADAPALPAAPVEVGRERDVALTRDPARHVPDVVVQAERLLDHQHRGGRRIARGARDVSRHAADVDGLRLDAHRLVSSSVGNARSYRRPRRAFNARPKPLTRRAGTA